jgi:hypothetical protein
VRFKLLGLLLIKLITQKTATTVALQLPAAVKRFIMIGSKQISL